MLPNIDELPKSIINTILQTPKFINVPSETISIVLTLGQLYDPAEKIIKKATLPASIDFYKQEKFPPLLPREKLIHPQALSRVEGIIEVLQNDKQLASMFMKACDKQYSEIVKNPRSMDIFTAFIVIFTSISKKFSISPPTSFITSPYIFSYWVTNYENFDDNFYQIINTIRVYCFNMMLLRGVQDFVAIIQTNFQHPLIFAEIMRRMISLQPKIDLKSDGIEPLLQSVMQAMIFYQSFENLSDREIDAINKAKIGLIIFFNNYLLDDNLIEEIFTNHIFISGFIGMLGDQSMQSFCIAHINRYISTKKSSQNIELLERIYQLAIFCVENCNDPEVVQLGCVTFELISTILTLYPNISSLFDPLFEDIKLGIVNIKDFPDSKLFIQNVLSFYANSVQHKFANPELIAMQNAISIIYRNEPTTNIFVKVLQIISRKHMTFLTNHFDIKEGKALRLLISIHENSSQIDTVLKFVHELISDSVGNAIMAHNGELDFYLIDLIYSWRNKEKTPENTSRIDLILNILTVILSQISSASLVRYFIRLICPNDGKSLPFYHNSIVQSMMQMMSASKYRPNLYLPLIDKFTFTMRGFKTSYFNKNFTLAFWIYIEEIENKYFGQVFLAVDEKDGKLGVFIAEDQIYIYMQKGGQDYTAKTEISIPPKKWNLVTIGFTMHQEDDKNTCSYSVNGEDSTFYLFPKIIFEQTEAKGLKIGGLTLDSAQPSQCSYLGPVSFYPSCLSREQILQLYDRKCSIVPSSKSTALFYLSPIEKDDEVTLINQINNDIVVDNISYQYNRTFNFAEVLVNHCGVEVLLPLFAQWDLNDFEGNKIDFYAESTVELLQDALMMSNFAQKIFADNEGFKIISHLIISSNQNHISYNLYMRFYTLFNNLNVFHAKESLFNEILLNNEIWMKTEALDHTRITRHWCRSLCTPNSPTIQFLSFSKLLSILKLYYWYEDEKAEHRSYHTDHCRGQKINVEECRKNVLSLAHHAAAMKFTDADFSLLMSHVLTTTYPNQITDFLVFIRELINDGILNKVDNSSLILLVQYLFNTNSENIAVILISTLIDAHKAGIVTNLSLSNNLDIILHQLSANFITKSNFEIFVAMCKATPELFTTCTWMAANLGQESIEYVIKNLPPKKEYTQSKNWSVFLIHSLHILEGKIVHKLITYLIDLYLPDLSDFISMIDVIGRTFDGSSQDTEDLIHDVIFNVGIIVHSNPEKITFGEYTKLMTHFMFFHSIENYNNLALAQLYSNSPYVLIKPKRSRRYLEEKVPATPPKAPKSSPQKIMKRKARHSIRRKSIVQFVEDLENYSPQLALRAMSKLKILQKMTTRRYSIFQKFKPSVTFSLAVVNIDGLNEFDDDIPEDFKLNEERAELLSIMPYDIGNKLALAGDREYSYVFGLRFDGEDSWADVDLALQFITLFLSAPSPEYLEIALIITAFLTKSGSDVSESVLDQISPEMKQQLPDPLLYLDKILSKDKVFKNVDENTRAAKEKACFEYIQSLDNKFRDRALDAGPLISLKAIMREQTNNSKTALAIFASISDELVGMANNRVNDDEDLIHSNKISNRKLWQKSWHVLTLEDSPWQCSLPDSLRKVTHYKRDNVLTAYGVPTNIKVNNNFDDHTLASLLRDKGSWWSAEEALEEEKRKLKETYEKDKHAPLFEIGDLDLDESETDESSSKKEYSMLYIKERCLLELPCEIIKLKKVFKAKFALFTDQIFINFENDKVVVIKSASIERIYFRTRLHHPTAIEIFLENGLTYLINFPGVNSLTILQNFDLVETPKAIFKQKVPFKPFFATTDFTPKWCCGQISNFEYLMELNRSSGRSFNDTSAYPIIPWVIRDYESLFLDLSDPKTYRDLTKPIGALNQERLSLLRSRVDALKAAGIQEPFLYSSTYNCPLSIFLMLLRLEPFTTLHIRMQSGRFDIPSRLFHSIPSLWEFATCNANDFRELIPEFFCCPEFLVNSDNFNLGLENSDVEMPKWAKNHFDFVYKNRKALESDFVSSKLSNWIDLVWGYKQKSYEYDNVYIREMYSDIWNQPGTENPAKRAENEAILSHVGQIPPQLFATKHPERAILPKKIPTLSKNVSVNMQMTNLLIATISLTNSPTKCKVTTIDEDCVSMTALFDASSLNKMTVSAISKSVNSPVLRSKSMSSQHVMSKPPTSLKKSTTRLRKDSSDKGFIVSDVHISCVATAKTKVVKGFRASESILFTETDDSTIYFAEENKCEIYKAFPTVTLFTRQRSSITSLYSDKNHIITSNSDNVVTVYDTLQGTSPLFTVPSYSSKVKSVAISIPFKMFCFGTKDCRLTIGSLNTGNVVRIADLNGRRAIKILITRGWGFIVVYSTDLSKGYLQHFIEIYSVNGDKINECELNSKVSCWYTYKNAKGFDYIVMATDQGDIFHFEAFYCDIGRRIFGIEAQVMSVIYHEEEGIVTAVIQDGRIIFISSILD
ncbi:Beige/BEACH domain containing protein [Trichomonas vaginalis G3]|uniref:Beige/BEACH domain containing protein n=1 Tax=Trichomonas vaginalis (strain ATCC PRA-98 / G3) TaxID=412133 RepID=A2E609_TRIV3|nr:beige/BEACH-related family [Trichomonas vaginalis G3]EAY11851.1 Beige/BEACH domain containing protein [Trichomonas vaginalis G3]KAI5532261.1 beige/BEACH-related family [Trichomonas vaginalis G3]|eukprot:XP_001324074.1 Beige/BEACH domain containing protein [Trichomonas vaginalis G3]